MTVTGASLLSALLPDLLPAITPEALLEVAPESAKDPRWPEAVPELEAAFFTLVSAAVKPPQAAGEPDPESEETRLAREVPLPATVVVHFPAPAPLPPPPVLELGEPLALVREAEASPRATVAPGPAEIAPEVPLAPTPEDPGIMNAPQQTPKVEAPPVRQLAFLPAEGAAPRQPEPAPVAAASLPPERIGAAVAEPVQRPPSPGPAPLRVEARGTRVEPASLEPLGPSVAPRAEAPAAPAEFDAEFETPAPEPPATVPRTDGPRPAEVAFAMRIKEAEAPVVKSEPARVSPDKPEPPAASAAPKVVPVVEERPAPAPRAEREASAPPDLPERPKAVKVAESAPRDIAARPAPEAPSAPVRVQPRSSLEPTEAEAPAVDPRVRRRATPAEPPPSRPEQPLEPGPLPPARTDAAPRTQRPAQPPSAEPIRGVAAIQEEPAAVSHPAPVRELRLRLPDANRPGAVEIQVQDRRSEMNVTVRARSPELAETLRQGLPELAERLSQQGLEAHVWRPAGLESPGRTWEAGLRGAEAALESRRAEGDASGGRHPDSQEQPQPDPDDEPPRWTEEWTRSFGARAEG